MKFYYRTHQVIRLLLKNAGLAGSSVLLLNAAASGQAMKPIVSCESLAKLELREATVTMAKTVAAGEFTMPPQSSGPGGRGGPEGRGREDRPGGQGEQGRAAGAGGQGERGGQEGQGRAGGPPRGMMGPFGSTDPASEPPFCRVALTLKPSGDSDIKMEIWLPLTTWNGKFFGAGNWGWGGSIRYDGLLLGLKNGYVTASNDTGHTDALGSTGQFAIGHPDKMIDYGYRANHETTLQAKAIIKAFYGSGPKRSYWVGCSLGGQQALTEAQRFPEDYDGIVAGAPANPIVRLNAWQIWPAVLVAQDPARGIPQSKMSLINQAYLNKCDELDGVKDGIVENPLNCRIDPQEFACKGGDAADCLIPPQVDLLKKLFTGMVNSHTGELLHSPMVPGGPGNLSGGSPMGVALGLFQNMIYQDPNWDWKSFNPDIDVPFGEKVLGTVNVSMNPNLKPFFDRGGKLMMYHGWADGNSPEESINYYKAVLQTVGPEAGNSMRVFAVPGMGHCSGGAGCDSFDKLAVIDQWIETGKAPDRIVASKFLAGEVIRTHPICAYPKVAVYKGTGSTDDAENFVCAEDSAGVKR